MNNLPDGVTQSMLDRYLDSDDSDVCRDCGQAPCICLEPEFDQDLCPECRLPYCDGVICQKTPDDEY